MERFGYGVRKIFFYIVVGMFLRCKEWSLGVLDLKFVKLAELNSSKELGIFGVEG